MRRIIIVGRNNEFPRFQPAPEPANTSWGPVLRVIMDAALTVVGLAIFGAIAFFFLVIA